MVLQVLSAKTPILLQKYIRQHCSACHIAVHIVVLVTLPFTGLHYAIYRQTYSHTKFP